VTGPVPFAGLPAGPAAVWVPDASNASDVQDPSEAWGEAAESGESGAPDASDVTDSGAVWLPAQPEAGQTEGTGGAGEAGEFGEVEEIEEVEDVEELGRAAAAGGPARAAQDSTETMVIERIVESPDGTELLADVRRLVPPPIPVAFRGLPVLAPAAPPAPEQPYDDPVQAPEIPPQRLYGESWPEVARQIGAEVTRWGAMRMAAIHHAPDRNADDLDDTVPPAVRTAAYFGFGRTPLEWDGTWYVGGEPLPGRMTPAVVVFGLAQHARDHPAVPP